MNLTAEQLQIASMIDAKMQELVCDGNDDITILGEMFDYMPVLQTADGHLGTGYHGRTVPAVCRIFPLRENP
jgi:hypothetical protein